MQIFFNGQCLITCTCTCIILYKSVSDAHIDVYGEENILFSKVPHVQFALKDATSEVFLMFLGGH